MTSKHCLLLLALTVLSVYSHAEVAINQTLNNQQRTPPMRCDYSYHQALQYQPTKHDTAITADEDMVHRIAMSRQFADEYIMSANITDFPTDNDLVNYDVLGNQINTDYIKVNNKYLTQEEVIQTLTQLYVYYFVGEYVPKDDYQAITYLKKLVDYYENDNPSQAGMLINLALLSFNYDEISQQNPIHNMDDKELVQIIESLLLQAGSINTKASLIKEDIYRAQPSCQDYLIKQFNTLANTGSVVAIYSLIEIYQELNNASGKYDNQIKYWQQQSETYAIQPNNLRFN